MKRDTRIVRAVAGAVPALILAAAVLCTWVISQGASIRWRMLFRMMCHGLEQRCLLLWGVPMPICSRCVAIYAGLLAGLALFSVFRNVRERTARWVAAVAVAPLAIDGLTQLAGLRESTNELRIATGLAAGFAFGFWLLAAVEHGAERASSAP